MPTSGREQGGLRRPPLNRAACLLVRPILIRPRGHAGGGRRSSGGRGARLCETLGARLPLVDIVFAMADGAVFRSNSEMAAFVRVPGLARTTSGRHEEDKKDRGLIRTQDAGKRRVKGVREQKRRGLIGRRISLTHPIESCAVGVPKEAALRRSSESIKTKRGVDLDAANFEWN